MQPAPLLTLVGVSKRFGRGGPRVVDEASLDLGPGGQVHLTGANGSGKTTLLRLAVGAVRPTAGTVRCSTWRTWAPVAPVGTDALTPRHLLVAMAGATGADVGRGAEMLDRLGASSFLDRRIGELSSGTRRKVTLALALAPHPGGVVVLDEPWSTLDAAAGDVLCDLLDAHAAGGSSIVFTDHGDAPERRRADRTLTLLAGRLVEHTSAGDAAATVTVTAIRSGERRTWTAAAGPGTDDLLRTLLADGWSIERVEPR